MIADTGNGRRVETARWRCCCAARRSSRWCDAAMDAAGQPSQAMCSSMPNSLPPRSPLAATLTSEVHARSGPGWEHRRDQPQVSDDLPERDKRRRRTGGGAPVQTAWSAAYRSAPRIKQTLLRDHKTGVQEISDDADPQQIGQHKIGPQCLLRRRDSLTDRVDRDLDRNRHDQGYPGGPDETPEISGNAAGMMILRTRSAEYRRTRLLDQAQLDPADAAQLRIRTGQMQAKATITISMR